MYSLYSSNKQTPHYFKTVIKLYATAYKTCLIANEGRTLHAMNIYIYICSNGRKKNNMSDSNCEFFESRIENGENELPLQFIIVDGQPSRTD